MPCSHLNSCILTPPVTCQRAVHVVSPPTAPQATAKALQYAQQQDLEFDGKSVIVVAGREGENLWSDEAPEFTVDLLGSECHEALVNCDQCTAQDGRQAVVCLSSVLHNWACAGKPFNSDRPRPVCCKPRNAKAGPLVQCASMVCLLSASVCVTLVCKAEAQFHCNTHNLLLIESNTLSLPCGHECG